MFDYRESSWEPSQCHYPGCGKMIPYGAVHCEEHHRQERMQAFGVHLCERAGCGRMIPNGKIFCADHSPDRDVAPLDSARGPSSVSIKFWCDTSNIMSRIAQSTHHSADDRTLAGYIVSIIRLFQNQP